MCWTPFKNRLVRCPSSQSCSDTWRPPVWLLCSLWELARAFVTADTFISSQSIWKWRKNVMMHEKIASLWILSETNYSCSLWGTPDTTGVLFPGPATENLGPAQKVSYTSGHWKCFVMLSLFSSKGRTPRRCKLKYSKALMLGWQMDSLTHTWYYQTVPHSPRLQSCTQRHTVSNTSVLQECSQLHGAATLCSLKAAGVFMKAGEIFEKHPDDLKGCSSLLRWLLFIVCRLQNAPLWLLQSKLQSVRWTWCHNISNESMMVLGFGLPQF